MRKSDKGRPGARRRVAGAQWAKFRPPRLARVVERARIGRILDDFDPGGVTWIGAPAGSGKTTAVAQWLAAGKINHLWYQVDARDADLAGFFHFLREAVRQRAPRRHEKLAALTPEYAFGIPAFTLNFFDELWRRIKLPAVLVLDNIQEVPVDAPLFGVLSEVIAALPDGARLICVSREAPAPTLARFQMEGRAQVLDFETLCLTGEEARALAAARLADPAPVDVERVNRDAQGWLAGFLLQIERGGGAHAPDVARKEVFDYLAAELLDKAPAPARRFLLHCALLPDMTLEQARALSGEADAAEILQGLVKKNFFISHHAGASPVYRLHPLFRHFLLERARREWEPSQWRERQRRAASILAAGAQFDLAGQLARDAGDEDLLTKLIVQHAPEILTQGRFATLEQWLDALAPATREASAWLCFWKGACVLARDPLGARQHLETALRLAEASADAAAAYLAWAAIVDSYMFLWDDFSGLPVWIERFEGLRARFPEFPAPEIEAKAITNILGAICYVAPAHPAIHQHYVHCMRLAATLPDDNARATALIHAALYSIWCGDDAIMDEVARSIRDVLPKSNLTPLSQIAMLIFYADLAWMRGDTETALSASARAIECAERSGVVIMSALVHAQAVYAALYVGNRADAARHLESMRQATAPVQRLNVSHWHFVHGCYAWACNDIAAARREWEQASAINAVLGAVFPLSLSNCLLALALAAQGEREAAAAPLAIADRLVAVGQNKHVLAGTAWTRALLALSAGDAAAFAAHLRVAMTGLVRGTLQLAMLNISVTATICAGALRQGIEVERVQELIRTLKIPAPANDADLPDWPRALRIHTLGRFGLVREGLPVRFTGKAHKKAFDLLKALIALGGRNVAQDKLCDTLWPDAEADLARQNLKATLHRVRSLIGHDVIEVHSGQIGLNANEAGVDIWDLEKLLNRILETPAPSATSGMEAAMRTAARQYRGDFLAGEEVAFALPLRLRLRTKFLRALEHCGGTLAAAGRHAAAREWFERGIDIDPLLERFYQGAMRCELALGRAADALEIHGRCVAQLHARLGINPSPATQALAASARSGA
jgi:LuxR family transcriptional regulator, maltose regulon positive regulatory protein